MPPDPKGLGGHFHRPFSFGSWLAHESFTIPSVGLSHAYYGIGRRADGGCGRGGPRSYIARRCYRRALLRPIIFERLPLGSASGGLLCGCLLGCGANLRLWIGANLGRRLGATLRRLGSCRGPNARATTHTAPRWGMMARGTAVMARASSLTNVLSGTRSMKAGSPSKS